MTQTLVVTSPRGLPRIIRTALVFLVLLAVVGAVFSAVSPYFLTSDNLVTLITSISVTGIVALPATFLIRAGQVDLSVGALAATSGVLLAGFAPDLGNVGAVLVAVIAGLLSGAIIGVLVCVLGVNSLAATFAAMALLRGIAYLLPGGLAVTAPNFSTLSATTSVFALSVPVLIFVGLLLAAVLVQAFTGLSQILSPRPSPVGRSGILGLGLQDRPLDAGPDDGESAGSAEQRRAARRHTRALIGMFVASGAAAALVGMILTSQLGTGLPAAAGGLELTVLTAVVLGGGSLAGGRGSVTGTLLALLVLSTVDNGLALVNISSYAQQVLHGALLVIALVADRVFVVLSARRRRRAVVGRPPVVE